MAAAARISLHIHKLVSKKGHWFLKKAKILPKLFESLVNIVTSFVWLRLYWLRLRRRKPLLNSMSKVLVNPDQLRGEGSYSNTHYLVSKVLK